MKKYQVSVARFSAGEAVIAPKPQEFTVTVKFAGAEKGVFPASVTGTQFTTKGNSLQLIGGEETRDFSAGMDLLTLMRIVKQSSGIRMEINLTHPNAFLKYYQSEGPLVRVTVTSDNQTDPTNDQSLVFDGLCKLPDISFLDGPGNISIDVESYGVQPLLTIPALPA